MVGSTFIDFDSVHVPVGNLIGREGQGFEIVMSSKTFFSVAIPLLKMTDVVIAFTHERVWVGITSNRLARVALEDSFNYAQQRKTFGKPLFDNQVIRAKFAKMGGLIEGTHALMESLVLKSTKLSQMEFSPWSALLKYRAAHDLEKVSRESQQIFGGAGYSRGGKGARIEQISRDVRVLVVSGGSEEILMDMIVKQRARAMAMSKL